jgi:hypothetical protein
VASSAVKNYWTLSVYVCDALASLWRGLDTSTA